jgi:Flp pilus assembly CpaF family ATPase
LKKPVLSIDEPESKKALRADRPPTEGFTVVVDKHWGTMVAIHPFQSEAISRGARMLRTAFGPAIARFLEDPAIIEVMLNPDGRLWIDRLAGGLAETTEPPSQDDQMGSRSIVSSADQKALVAKKSII